MRLTAIRKPLAGMGIAIIDIPEADMNQCERILKYLDEHGSITRAEAMSECGIANFTARVSDLRRDGVALDVETVTQKNRYGETVRFARYRRKENGTEII